MSAPAYEFDAATALVADGEGRWAVDVQDGWDFAGIPNGGYLMAIAARALTGLTGRPDPVTMTAHFVARAAPGPAALEGRVLRAGRRLATASAELRQGDRVVAHVLGTFGDFDLPHSAVRWERGLPSLPEPDECVAPAPHDGFVPPPITDRVEIRLHPGHAGFGRGAPHGVAEISGWARFPDGRPVDTIALPLLADALPPPVFNAGLPIAWVPTIELTVHIHKRPAPGWVGTWFGTDHISGGFLEEDGILWDRTGEVVAVSRQLAVVPA